MMQERLPSGSRKATGAQECGEIGQSDRTVGAIVCAGVNRDDQKDRRTRQRRGYRLFDCVRELPAAPGVVIG